MADPAKCGYSRCGYTRCGVYTDEWARLVSTLKKGGSLDPNVTRRRLYLTSRDGTTGWRQINYAKETIEAVTLSRGASFSYQGVGVYTREDKAFLTQDPLAVYDQIKTDYDEKHYIVKSVKEHMLLNSFFFREAQCAELPMWQTQPATASSSLTRASDPRDRTKVYIDTYARDAQITRNDDSSEAVWATVFAEPPYPLELEFRGVSNMEGVYAVDYPVNSTPLMDPLTQAPYGYEEHVPIHIYTIDNKHVTGTILNWKMEAELRYVAETYPTGSLRSMRSSRPELVHLGSTDMYKSSFIFNYRRNVTT